MANVGTLFVSVLAAKMNRQTKANWNRIFDEHRPKLENAVTYVYMSFIWATIHQRPRHSIVCDFFLDLSRDLVIAAKVRTSTEAERCFSSTTHAHSRRLLFWLVF